VAIYFVGTNADASNMAARFKKKKKRQTTKNNGPNNPVFCRITTGSRRANT